MRQKLRLQPQHRTHGRPPTCRRGGSELGRRGLCAEAAAERRGSAFVSSGFCAEAEAEEPSARSLLASAPSSCSAGTVALRTGEWGAKKRMRPVAASFGDPGGARTLDPLIKSQLLYQLSYGVVSALRFCGANLRLFFEVTKFFANFFHFFGEICWERVICGGESGAEACGCPLCRGWPRRCIGRFWLSRRG